MCECLGLSALTTKNSERRDRIGISLSLSPLVQRCKPTFSSRWHPRPRTAAASHAQVASALDDLASALLFHRDDDYTDMKAVTLLPEAETLAARSLAISRSALGEDHPITAGREHNLGMVKRGLQKQTESL